MPVSQQGTTPINPISGLAFRIYETGQEITVDYPSYHTLSYKVGDFSLSNDFLPQLIHKLSDPSLK